MSYGTFELDNNFSGLYEIRIVPTFLLLIYFKPKYVAFKIEEVG